MLEDHRYEISVLKVDKHELEVNLFSKKWVLHLQRWALLSCFLVVVFFFIENKNLQNRLEGLSLAQGG